MTRFAFPSLRWIVLGSTSFTLQETPSRSLISCSMRLESVSSPLISSVKIAYPTSTCTSRTSRDPSREMISW